jgi:hypothetical protein
MVPRGRVEEVGGNSSKVASDRARSACMACRQCAMTKARTIRLLHQGDGVHNRWSAIFSAIIVSQRQDQADKWAHVDGDTVGQLQVIQFLLKAVARVGQVAGGVGILWQAG